MVNIDGRVQQIKNMVDRGDYFCINRGRQYGKTTTLRYLKKALDAEYTVFSISFEEMSDASFASLENCGRAFFERMAEALEYDEVRCPCSPCNCAIRFAISTPAESSSSASCFCESPAYFL